MRTSPVAIHPAFLASLLALGALAACRQPPQATASPQGAIDRREPTRAVAENKELGTFPTGWRFPAGTQATFAEHSMVVSNSRLASEAGDEILRAGGNAVDAAVDYREVAPLAASRDMYVDAEGKLTNRSIVGHLASGVPGSVAGMNAALRQYGTKSLAEVVAPAIRLAEEGFVVDSAFSRGIDASKGLIGRFEGRDESPSALLRRNASPGGTGSLGRNPLFLRGRAQAARLAYSRGLPGPFRGSLESAETAPLIRVEPSWRAVAAQEDCAGGGRYKRFASIYASTPRGTR